MFTLPLEATRLSDQAESMIAEQITRGDLKVGQQLPGERELVNRLGVSRTVVREAIGRLESRGILRVHAGRGTFVTGTADSALNGRWQTWVGGDLEKVLTMLEVRETLEAKAAGWAVDRATEAEVVELRLAYEAFERAVGGGSTNDLSMADKLFHYRLALAAHNSVLTSFVQTINETIAASRRSILAQPAGALRSLKDHRLILERVEARDRDGAMAAVAAHIQRVYRDILRLQTGESGQHAT